MCSSLAASVPRGRSLRTGRQLIYREISLPNLPGRHQAEYTEHTGDSNNTMCKHKCRRYPRWQWVRPSICQCASTSCGGTPGDSGYVHALMYSYALLTRGRVASWRGGAASCRSHSSMRVPTNMSEPGGSNPAGLSRSFRGRTRRVPSPEPQGRGASRAAMIRSVGTDLRRPGTAINVLNSQYPEPGGTVPLPQAVLAPQFAQPLYSPAGAVTHGLAVGEVTGRVGRDRHSSSFLMTGLHFGTHTPPW